MDVGTAQGDCAVLLALTHEHLSGIGFDLPPVQHVFDAYVIQSGLQDRLRFIAGDFFQQDLPEAEMLILGHVLHDWNLQEKQLLIRKAYEALPSDGALIVYETIIDDDRRENTAGLLMSLNMLIETRGGFDYTGADCASWMREAGFRHTYIEDLSKNKGSKMRAYVIDCGAWMQENRTSSRDLIDLPGNSMSEHGGWWLPARP